MSILFSLWVVRVGEICMRPINGAAGARKKWGCGVEKRGWLFSILFLLGLYCSEDRRERVGEGGHNGYILRDHEMQRAKRSLSLSLSQQQHSPPSISLDLLGLQLCHNGGAQLAAGKVKENLTFEYDGKEYNHSRLNWEQDITTVTAAETFHFPSAARARYRGAKKREKLLFSLRLARSFSPCALLLYNVLIKH